MSPAGVWEVISELCGALSDVSGDIVAPNGFENRLFSIFDDLRTPFLGGFCVPGWCPGGHLGGCWCPLGGFWRLFSGFVSQTVKL